MQQIIVGRLSHDPINEILPFRARSHQRHIALQDIPELWQLIQPILTHHPPEGSDPPVVLAGEQRPPLLGIHVHRAKLINPERPSPVSDPLLAEKSSIREYTVIRREYDKNDGTPYGEGCYFTQDDIREIVRYALDRHIQIIPEIDMPGHMLAALASYPEFGCTGGPYKVWTRWGVSDQVLCVGKDRTVQFAKDVLSEVASLFPCRYIHIGGDECPKTEWEKCPDCQERIKAEGIVKGDAKSVEDALQGWFMKEMAVFLKGLGKTVIGWDELLESGAAGNDMVVMSWRGVEGGIAAAKQHTDAIMVPHSYLYFDYYQTEDRSQEPFAAGGKVTVEKVYNYDPLEGIPAGSRRYILGVQANLWTEFIPDEHHAQHMVIPRIDALSEVQWCPLETRDYPDFLQRLGRQKNLYDQLGYEYAPYVFEGE